MSLRVRATRISAITEQGRFGYEGFFDDGLSFVRAENNMGKTTTLMAILYALGWEGMLGPGREVPLTPAVTSEIADSSGQRLLVLEASVTVELEGARGAKLTLRRPIVSDSERRELVHSWDGPALTVPSGDYESRDYYIRLPGAAQREAGLHHRLAQFMGWALPEVTTWDSGSVPLYTEILAPFLFVEQTRGWAWIASVMPRYLRVRDPERRAIEFLLSLDSLTRARERDGLLAQRDELRSDWRSTVDAFRGRVNEIGGLLENVPRDPTADWPPPVLPAIRVLHDEQWRSIETMLQVLRAELTEISREVPRVEEVAAQVAEQLRGAEARSNYLSGLVAASARDVREQQAEKSALEERMNALREDRARYDDAIRLRELGSLTPLAVGHALCPTCEQRLPATLLGPDVGPVMGLEENRLLIDEELKTFGAMRDDARNVLVASQQRLVALRSDLDDVRRGIRSLKSTLTQNGEAPSRAAIAQQVRLSDKIERLEELEQALAGLNTDLAAFSAEHRRISGELGRLGERGGPSATDREKLRAFGDLFREQLADYGFTSVPPAEVQLTPDAYLPMRDDMLLRPERLSASDRVRVVWAYLVGLLEMSRRFETAHPGVIIFDEPGQQDISDASLRSFFRRLSTASSYEQQVIVATSKSAQLVRTFTHGVEAALMDIHGYTLKPENAAQRPPDDLPI
jgi:hypothetical protein